MVKVTIFYPNSPGARFDMNYYTTSHMPMVQKKVSTCKGIAAEKGLAGEARARHRRTSPSDICCSIRLKRSKPLSPHMLPKSWLMSRTTPIPSR